VQGACRKLTVLVLYIQPSPARPCGGWRVRRGVHRLRRTRGEEGGLEEGATFATSTIHPPKIHESLASNINPLTNHAYFRMPAYYPLLDQLRRPLISSLTRSTCNVPERTPSHSTLDAPLTLRVSASFVPLFSGSSIYGQSDACSFDATSIGIHKASSIARDGLNLCSGSISSM
jgi:hypothetical protein